MSLIDSFIGLIRPPGKPGGKARVEKRSESAFMPSETAVGPAAVILVAEFAGPVGKEISNRLSDMLGRQSGIDVYRRSQVLKLSGRGAPIEQFTAVAEEGRAWTAEVNADLLIWGELSPTGAAVAIRFMPAVGDADGSVGAFGLGDSLDLPLPLSADMEQAVVAVALAAAARARTGARNRVVELMRAALKPVEGMIEPPGGVAGASRAAFLNCLGNALATDYRLGGAPTRLDQALACYRSAVASVSPATSPVGWALSQNHLADALLAIDERDKSAESLQEAADTYRAVVDSLGRADHPMDWALAHIRLGQVLYRLGVREGRASHFRASAASYEQALTVYTREAMPGRWAELMNNYGVLLNAIGEQVTGTVALEQAAGVFRKAIEVRKRLLAPLLWAQTANNLGAAAFALAKRNGDAALMREACDCFEGAIEVYRERGQTAKVHVIEKNLQRVQRLLQTRGAAPAATGGGTAKKSR